MLHKVTPDMCKTIVHEKLHNAKQIVYKVLLHHLILVYIFS
jgi:hypothetical protein